MIRQETQGPGGRRRARKARRPVRRPAAGGRASFIRAGGPQGPPGPYKTAAAPRGLWIPAGEGQEITGLPGARGRRGGMEMENNRG